MISPGTLVAGYRIERVLGTGGMGTVYAARNPRLPRLDALKILGAQLSADGDFRIRFQREADIAATLDHPNIVSIYDRGETAEGQLWIAMQLVDGTDAEQALHQGKMNPRRAVDVIAEVAEALDYAHRRSVVHRDIKPANFLIAALDQRDERALLADFGIARALDDAGLTGTTAVMATAAFAAPEVTSGSAASARSDLYSLGASLFRLLTGHSPYAGAGTSAAQILAHLREPPPKVSDAAPWLPAAFDDVISTAMAKDPAKRYSSAREMADAAAAALRLSAARSDATERTVPASTLAGEVTQAGAQPHGLRNAQTDRRSAPPHGPPARSNQKRRRRTVAVLSATVVVLAAVAITAVVATHGGDDNAEKPGASTRVSATPLIVPSPVQVADQDLPALLLPPDQVATIMGAQLDPQALAGALANDDLNVTPSRCISVLMPAQKSTYNNTGFSAVSYQPLGPNNDGVSVIESVVSFPSAEMASAFSGRQPELWRQCTDSVLTVWSNRATTFIQRDYALGRTKQSGQIASVVATRADKPIACQHAVTAAGNVVVDAIACRGPAVADQAVTVVKAIAAKVH